MNIIKSKKYLFAATLVLFFLQGFITTACSNWTETEAEDYYKAPTKSYLQNLIDYKNSPHKVMFGWFGNWAGKSGASMQYSLCGLPDSVDIVSLWLMLGNITPAQQADLDEFHAKGSKAVYCFTSNDIGKFATPKDVTNINEYWGIVEGDESSYLKAAEKYALAIADSCEKYNVDGFDIDMELQGTLINFSKPERLDTFMKTLLKEFKKKDRLLIADIPAGWNSYYDVFSDDVVKELKYIIWQSYDIAGQGAYLDNMFKALERYHTAIPIEDIIRKSILTATFERAIDKPKFKGIQTYHSSYGVDHAGMGAYHIEYDYPGKPDYSYVREAIAAQNPPINK